MDKGKRLRELRDLAGLSQFEVQHGTGINRSRLSTAENGHSELTDSEYENVVLFLSQSIREKFKSVQMPELRAEAV